MQSSVSFESSWEEERIVSGEAVEVEVDGGGAAGVDVWEAGFGLSSTMV